MRERIGRDGIFAVVSVQLAMAIVVLDTAMVNVTLPAVAASLAVPPATALLAVTAYQAALLLALLPCAAIAERFGHRRVFRAGIVVFVLASCLSAAASTLPVLVICRFLQGLGGGAILALGIALMRFALPKEAFGRAVGWNAMTVAVCSAAGPSIGVAMLTIADWHAVFLIGVPLAIGALAASRALPPVPGFDRAPDNGGMAIYGVACLAWVIGCETVITNARLGIPILLFAAVILLLLVRRQGRRTAGLLPLDLLAAPAFRTSVLASVFGFIGQTCAMIALPFHLVHGVGQPAWSVGLLIAPWPVAATFTAPVAGRLAATVSTAQLCFLGGLIMAGGLLGIAAASPDRAVLLLLMMIGGAGFGLFQVSNNRNMFLSAPEARSGTAGGLQGTARLLGQTAGGLIMTALFTHTQPALSSRAGLAVASLMVLLAGIVSLGRKQIRRAA